MKFIISGGWSYGNIGDEAIAAATIHLFENTFPDGECVYTSYAPEDFRKNHPGKTVVPSVHKLMEAEEQRFENICRDSSLMEDPLLSGYRSLFSGDCVYVMSGGGYFKESWHSQYLARLIEISVAKQMGAKVVLIGQTMGPFYTQKARQEIGHLLNTCDYLSVRDETTREHLQRLGVRKPVYVNTDVAIVVSDVFPKKEKQEKLIVNFMPANYVAYSGVHTKRIKNKLLRKIKNKLSLKRLLYIKFCRDVARLLIERYNAEIHFVPSTNWSWDIKFVNRVAATLPSKAYKISQDLDVRSLCEELSKGNLVISTKMHPLIVSASYLVPGIAVSYDYKIDGFMKRIGCSFACLNIDKLTPGSAEKALKIYEETVSNPDFVSTIRESKRQVENMMLQIRDVCSGVM